MTRDGVGLRPMRYPALYSWIVLLSALDVIFTILVLTFGGYEVNAIAATLIVQWGIMGAALYKFSLVVFAIVLCEVVGRMCDASGRRLALLLAAIAAIPVVWSMALLLMNRHALEYNEQQLMMLAGIN